MPPDTPQRTTVRWNGAARVAACLPPILALLGGSAGAAPGAPDIEGAPPSAEASDAVDLDAIVDIAGGVPTPRRLTIDEMATFGPLTTVHVPDERGGQSDYTGIRVQTLLEACGVRFGGAQDGAHLAGFAVATGRDGRRVVYTLAEFDAAFSDREAILAWRRDGAPLPDGEGPLRLVLTGDARPTRWMRGVRRIELRTAND